LSDWTERSQWEGMFPPFLCRFCVVSWKIVSNFKWMDRSVKKVSVNVLQVMGYNFLVENFALRSLIWPQLANWIIGQNFGDRAFVR
jgi:hypothetical protein